MELGPKEYLALSTNGTEAGSLIKENNLTLAIELLLSNYAAHIKLQCETPIISDQVIEDRCKEILRYLIPNFEVKMTSAQYLNTLEALSSIYYGKKERK